MAEVTHEKTPDTHSSIVGGSSAARIMGCPASHKLLEQLPASVLGESSAYADEGTGLHEVMAYIVDNDLTLEEAINDPKIDEIWAQFKLDDQRWFDAVVPAFNAFDKMCEELLDEGGPDDELRIRVETEVHMPGIDGAFGTCDILIWGPKRTVVWDWKFGAGVPVYASYTKTFTPVHIRMGVDNMDVEEVIGDPETEEFGNEQLMFYARGAMETHPDYFDHDNTWPVRLVICQPRIGEGEPSWFDTDVGDLEAFRLDLVDAVDEALTADKPHMEIGKYCRFAKCKTLCPLHLGSAGHAANVAEKLGRLSALKDQSLTVEDIAKVEYEIIPPGTNLRMQLSTGEMYAVALALKETLEPMLKGIADDAQTFIEAGGVIPAVYDGSVQIAEAWKLVPKKAGHDKWLDDDKAEKYLGRQGIPLEERRVVKPITPAVARTKLKAMGKLDAHGTKNLAKYVDPGVSSGHTLAPESDSRPAVQSTANAVAALADKIGALTAR